MWLLDTTTITLHLILSNPIPPYAILSHTWGSEEVTLQDLQCTPPRNQHLSGYKKIVDCCAQARLDGFYWVWIDACCIDKTNSAELSEAINSMFEWYRNAVQCYAYLSDTEAVNEVVKSRWFTRGWTLQELLAPLSVIFFDKHWKELGTKASLAKEISARTGIPHVVLLTNSKGEFSVAQIMSWAAKRETTREEDMAYSLLGLFGVNMPMIYGEGKKAFRRLQLEIMKASDDHSIFAWVGAGKERGPVALSPAEFEHSGKIARCVATDRSKAEYTMTNRGLRINFRLTGPCDLHPHGEVWVASLDCTLTDGRPIGIYVRQKQDGQFVRSRCRQLTTQLPKKGKTKVQELYFGDPYSTTFDISQWMRTPLGLYLFDITYRSILEHGFVLHEHYTSSQYAVSVAKEETPGLRLSIDGSDEEGEFVFKHTEKGDRFLVTVGIYNHQVWSDISTTSLPETKPWLDPDLADEFNKHGLPASRRNIGRWMGLDRGSCELANNLFAAVAIRNAIVRGEKQFLVTVTISRAQAPSSPVISDGGVEVIRENIKVHKLAEKKGLDYLKI